MRDHGARARQDLILRDVFEDLHVLRLVSER